MGRRKVEVNEMCTKIPGVITLLPPAEIDNSKVLSLPALRDAFLTHVNINRSKINEIIDRLNDMNNGPNV